MAITKTDFINYTRCPRYASLEEINKEKLLADITFQEYEKQNEEAKLGEILSCMYEDESFTNSIVEKEDARLKAMQPFYKLVELVAGEIFNKYFPGKTIYSKDNFDQECFEFNRNGIKYLCYVDIYNENKNNINIVEVKATTSLKFLNLKGNYRNKEKYSIFYFDANKNCYILKDEIKNYNIEDEMPQENYNFLKNKLFDRYSKVGSYIYDLAIQRFIVEGDYGNKISKNIHYYLAILNHKYVFDGLYKDGKPIYKKDKNGNELITFIDLTNITLEYQKIIKDIVKKLEKDLFTLDARECPLGKWCSKGSYNECPYFKNVCGRNIPESNSVLNYMHNTQGFKMPDGKRLKGLDLINNGYLNMLDIPDCLITNKVHKIQREAVKYNKYYIDIEKIKAGLSTLQYPIYHLDFETMPSPVPRFKGESPYTQSPFEFSLHIEEKPGVCNKDKDNFIFLAKTFSNDEREELIKELLKHVDPSKGTLFAQNVSFEKGRIKELANIFPKYKEKLMNLYNRGFDLLWLINTKKELYMSLGFDKERSMLPNYYSKDLSGSYSIKKTLPVFSDLTYKDLTVQNGNDAIVTYANYNNMTKEEYKLYYEALKTYCKQDTWAMVVILDALRKLCHKEK